MTTDDDRSPVDPETDDSPSRIDELIALAALGELTPAEEAELDAALGDPAIAAEAHGALETAAALQRSTESEVPAHLRASVLASIEGVAQVGPSVGPAERPDADVVDLSARRRRRIAVALSAAAAVVLAVVGSVALFVTDGSDVDDPVAAVVEADDTVARVLDGELTGRLEVVYSPGSQAIAVVGSGLEPIDESLALQLWLIAGDDATPVGTFRPDADGSVRERFDDIDPTGFTVGVTREPASGSSTPTPPILATA